MRQGLVLCIAAREEVVAPLLLRSPMWLSERGRLLYRLRVAVRCAAAISNPGSFNPDQEQKTPVPELDEAGRAAHKQFMEYVRDLILGEREPSQFEDDVRALLGESAAPSKPLHMELPYSVRQAGPWQALACSKAVLPMRAQGMMCLVEEPCWCSYCVYQVCLNSPCAPL